MYDIDKQIYLIVSYLILAECDRRDDAVRIRNYFEITIPNYPNDTFKKHFRLSRSAVEKLARTLSVSDNMQKNNRGGRRMVPIEKQVLIFLWYSGNHGTIRCRIR